MAHSLLPDSDIYNQIPKTGPLRFKGKIIRKKRRSNLEPSGNIARVDHREALEEMYGHQHEHIVFGEANQSALPDDQHPEEDENHISDVRQDENSELDIAEHTHQNDEDKTRDDEGEEDEELDPSMFMTEAEYKFELARQKREKELLAKQAKTTFRDQIHKFNAKLAKEPAHFDVPKISHTK